MSHYFSPSSQKCFESWEAKTKEAESVFEGWTSAGVSCLKWFVSEWSDVVRMRDEKRRLKSFKNKGGGVCLWERGRNKWGPVYVFLMAITLRICFLRTHTQSAPDNLKHGGELILTFSVFTPSNSWNISSLSSSSSPWIIDSHKRYQSNNFILLCSHISLFSN